MKNGGDKTAEAKRRYRVRQQSKVPPGRTPASSGQPKSTPGRSGSTYGGKPSSRK